MLRTAGDMLGDWADRAPGWGVLACLLAGTVMWWVLSVVILTFL